MEMETNEKECKMEEVSPSSPAAISIEVVGKDLIHNILSRLPAVSFASAACVSRSWNHICDSILSTPKLSSALSLNPSLKDGIEEVFNKVFAEPIRPHFAIVSVGASFSHHEACHLITEKLGSTVPLVSTAPSGLIGRDVATDEVKEIQWEEEIEDEIDDYFSAHYNHDPFIEDSHSAKKNTAVLLTVGFFPGLKFATVPMFQSKKDFPYVDEFVSDIRQCTAHVSGCTSPIGIMLFADIKTDSEQLLEKLDYAMSPDTFIVGDGKGVFVYGGDNMNKNVKRANLNPVTAAVALLFLKDRDKPHGPANMQFDVALSSGLLPIGPTFKAISVKDKRNEGSTWLTAKRDGFAESLDGQTILNHIYEEMGDRIQYPAFYIGVVEKRKCSVGLDKVKWMTSQVFHEVYGGDEEYLYVGSGGIKTGNIFRFFHSDIHGALSSCSNVSDKFRHLKQDWNVGSSRCSSTFPAKGDKKKIIGGIIFSCCGRGEHFFGQRNVDSSPFLENFPGVTLAGSFCGEEICRGNSSSYSRESEQGSYRCCVHSYGSVYLVMSYTPSISDV